MYFQRKSAELQAVIYAPVFTGDKSAPIPAQNSSD